MSLIPKRPGQSARETYTADWYNWVSKELRNLISSRSVANQYPRYSNSVIVEAIPDPESTVEAKRFDPVHILSSGTVATGTNDKEQPRFNSRTVRVNTDDLDPIKSWGVAQAPINGNVTSNIVIYGLTWARFEMREDWHTTVDVVSGSLKSSIGGRAKIILPPETDSEIGLIDIGSRSNVIITGTLYEAFTGTPVSYKVVPTRAYGHSLPQPTEGYVTVNNLFSWEDGTEGNAAAAIFDPISETWDAIQLECV